jgi:CheY-like chemotaxis protein
MALEGTLNYLDIAHLLQVVGTSEKSGVLEISWQEREAKLLFQRGRLVRAESNRFRDGIGTLLVRAGVLTPAKLEDALAVQRSEGGDRRLGAILCDDYGVEPKDIERILQGQFERAAFDVFSWPGGSFVFHFHEPEAAVDRFSLNAVEFILEVGIQAGMLAEEGVEREERGREGPQILFFLQDHDIMARCHHHWRGKGHQVTCCERVEQVLGCVEGWQGGGTAPVVVADLVCPSAGDRGLLGGLEVLDAVQALRPDVPVVVLGESSDPKARIAAQSHGARAYVKKPTREDLSGPQGETHLDVFLISLEKAIERAISRAADQGAEARA